MYSLFKSVLNTETVNETPSIIPISEQNPKISKYSLTRRQCKATVSETGKQCKAVAVAPGTNRTKVVYNPETGKRKKVTVFVNGKPIQNDPALCQMHQTNKVSKCKCKCHQNSENKKEMFPIQFQVQLTESQLSQIRSGNSTTLLINREQVKQVKQIEPSQNFEFGKKKLKRKTKKKKTIKKKN